MLRWEVKGLPAIRRWLSCHSFYSTQSYKMWRLKNEAQILTQLKQSWCGWKFMHAARKSPYCKFYYYLILKIPREEMPDQCEAFNFLFNRRTINFRWGQQEFKLRTRPYSKALVSSPLFLFFVSFSVV